MGVVDILAIETSRGEESFSRGKYKKYTNKDRFDIGKYASENGSAASVRRFQTMFPKLNESTIRGFQKMYENELPKFEKKGGQFKELSIEKRGRPLLLGRLDEMVERYIRAASNRGAVITRSVAVSTAKAYETLSEISWAS